MPKFLASRTFKKEEIAAVFKVPMPEIRTLPTTEFRIATAADGTRTLSGLIPYNSRSVDLGGWTEMIAPGAFSNALMATSDVLCLRDHNSSLLMGRTKSKTLSLTDSPEGLRYACSLPKTSQAADLVESVDRGDLDATSFGFVTRDDKWAADASGDVLRTLMSIDLHEVSPCSFPAYPASQVTLRNCPAEIRSILAKRMDMNPLSPMDMSEDPNDNGCACQCAECSGNSCENCSNANCEDDNCLKNQTSRSLVSADEVRRLRIRMEESDVYDQMFSR